LDGLINLISLYRMWWIWGCSQSCVHWETN